MDVKRETAIIAPVSISPMEFSALEVPVTITGCSKKVRKVKINVEIIKRAIPHFFTKKSPT